LDVHEHFLYALVTECLHNIWDVFGTVILHRTFEVSEWKVILNDLGSLAC
jgi:hypothetical protein